MSVIITVLLFLSFAAALSLENRYFFHILQLHSYDSAIQIKWMRKKAFQIVPKDVFALLTVPLMIFTGETGMILSGIIYIILAYVYKPRELTSPMEYNKTTAKILTPVFIINLIFIVLAIILSENKIILPVIFLLLYALSPLLVSGVNAVFSKGFAKQSDAGNL